MNATVNLDQQFERVHDHWHPRIVATVNDDEVKLAKVQGNSSGTSIRTPTSCSWSSTASCAASSSTTATSSSGRGELLGGAAWGAPLSSRRPGDPRSVLELRDAVNTGDADRAGTVGERLT